MTHVRPSSRDVIAFGAAILAVAALAFWAMQVAGPARAALEQQRLSEIAQENHLLCEKWGFPLGTTKHVACMADLRTIRDQQEKRFFTDAGLL